MLLLRNPARRGAVVIERILVALEDVEAGGRAGVSARSASLASGHGAERGLAPGAGGRCALEVRPSSRAAAACRSTRQTTGGEHGRRSPRRSARTSRSSPRSRRRSRSATSYTGEHSESVVDLTERVAEALGARRGTRSRTSAPPRCCTTSARSASPTRSFTSPARSTNRSGRSCASIPAIGERILRAIPGMGPIARIVRHEHERWDGGGYPDGLAGDAIPIGARGSSSLATRTTRWSRTARTAGDVAPRRHGRAHLERRHPVRPEGRPGAGGLPVRPPPGSGLAAV